MIKTHNIDPQAADTANRIASLTGVSTTPERWYSDGKAEYWHIAGGLAWPTDEPGAVVVVGVRKTDPVTFAVLEVSQNDTVADMMAEAVELKEKYQSETKDLMQVFWGDWSKYSGLVGDFNLKGSGLYLSPPPDFDSPMAGLIYWRTVESYLSKSDKRLFLNGTHTAPEIQKLVGLGVQNKHSVKDFSPTVMALGFCVHAMRAARYWESNASHEVFIPTAGDPLSQTAYAEEIALRELFGDTNDHDGMVATV